MKNEEFADYIAKHGSTDGLESMPQGNKPAPMRRGSTNTKVWYATLEYGNYTLWVIEKSAEAAADALINALDSDTSIGPLTDEEIESYTENMNLYQVRIGEVQWD